MRYLLLIGVIGGALAAQTTAPKQAVAKQVPSNLQVAPKQAALKSTYLKPGATKPAQLTARTTVKKAPPRPSYYGQLQPSPDRYKEIQQALVDKGYFSGSPDGVWGASSTEALKRFQHDQNLSEDGKVDALSLIALGLGPKRTLVAADPPVTK